MSWEMGDERLTMMRSAASLPLAFALGACTAWLIATALTRRYERQLPDDTQLRRRVRERVAGLASQPDAIEVTVENGVVRVSGPIAASEQDLLLSELTQVRGVRKVYNALQPVPGQ
jgi:hypothetical protein